MAAAALVAALSLGAGGWLLPLAVSARRPHRLIRGMLAGAALCVLAVWGGAAPPYSAARPQRVMLFHTRRWEHVGARVQELPPVYWLPDLDDNSPSSLLQYVPEFRGASPVCECGRRLYCGAPYYLPVLSLIPASHRLPAPAPPLPAARADVTAAALDATTHAVSLNVTGPAHIVIIASPVEGARISWTNVVPELQESTPWGSRRTYFIALHRAREPAPWHLQLHIQHNFKTPPSHWLDLSIAGHSMFGDQKLHPDHERLLKSLPPWVAATGWGVDLHLYTV